MAIQIKTSVSALFLNKLTIFQSQRQEMNILSENSKISELDDEVKYCTNRFAGRNDREIEEGKHQKQFTKHKNARGML